MNRTDLDTVAEMAADVAVSLDKHIRGFDVTTGQADLLLAWLCAITNHLVEWMNKPFDADSKIMAVVYEVLKFEPKQGDTASVIFPALAGTLNTKITNLQEFCHDPTSCRLGKDELESLREFCVELSKAASLCGSGAAYHRLAA